MPHWLIDVSVVAFPIVGALWLFLQLSIKGTVGETNGLIREHIARDEEKHKSMDYRLEQHDRRLDNIERSD